MLFAEFTIWPLLIIWVVAMMLGGKKKRPQAGGGTPAGGSAEPQGLMGELSRALQELKRAEQEAVAKRLGVDPASLQATPRAKPKPAGADAYRLGTRGEGAKGAKLVKRQIYMPKGAPVQARAKPRPIEYDPDQSFEDPTVISLEALDYDDDAERLVQSRIAAAERRDVARTDTSVEGMSADQLARRADRSPATAIGGQAQHEAWHLKRDAMVAAEAPAERPAGKRLARFASGRMRDAVVLSEILGKPVGDR